MRKKTLSSAIKFLVMMIAACMSLGYAYAQNRTISGKVVDTNGDPVIGAAVTVVGNTRIGAATDINGNFSLSVPAGATINVESIGYKNQTFAIGNQTNFNIILEEDTEMLEETVVIGYGVQKKSDVTGAIASLKSDDLQNRSATDAVQAMQGKAAGVQIVNSSGAPGATSNIQIRGYSSNSKTSPLMIVDGLKVRSIDYLDPENIESMEILKDAASAAIYGVEAGNGVILITTKSGSGQKGTGRVFYNFQHTMQSVARTLDVMNAKDWMEYMKLAGAATDATFEYDGHTDMFWPDYMFETGHMDRHTVGFQGGNDRGNLYVSLTSLKNNGIITGDKDIYNRLTGQINADYKINKWLQVGVTTSIIKNTSRSVSESTAPGTNLMGSIFTYDPITPWSYPDSAVPERIRLWEAQGYDLPKDPATGQFYGATVFSGNSLIWHPAVMRDRTDSESNSFTINGTAYVNLTPIKGLTITSRLGYRSGHTVSHSYNYELFVNPTENQAFSISGSASTNLYYQWENFANYNFTLGKMHNFNVMAGMSFQHTDTDSITGRATALTSYEPNFRYLSNSVNNSQMTVGGTPGESANMSYYGRIGWSYGNRYNIQANFRADAYDTSKLDKDHRWGYFPSVSAGWTLSNEPFMANFKNTTGITFLKLRASWGINGNVNALGSYQYSSTLSLSGGYNLGGTTWTNAVQPSSVLPNPAVSWETSHQTDIGLDLRAFRDRLTLALDWYNKDTHDLLTSTSAPANTGATTVYVNAGQVNNHGTEIELAWKDNVGDFSYSISGNLATVHNKVVKGTSKDRVEGTSRWSSLPLTYFEEGYPMWYLRTFVVDHIDQATGDAVYKDLDKNGEINADDREMTGSGIPDFTYGLTINLAWKGFDFTIYGAGSQGAELFYSVNRGDFFAQNTLNEFYHNAWQSPSSSGYKYPKPNVADNWMGVSDLRVFDASFFKIKQIQLGYTVPRNIVKKIALSSLRAYISLDDWFTFTKYPGLDPETSNMGASSNGSGLGIDFGQYPISKKLVFGVNVSF
jgi:TonB-linked SusC/RagA family outer membrane protein